MRDATASPPVIFALTLATLSLATAASCGGGAAAYHPTAMPGAQAEAGESVAVASDSGRGEADEEAPAAAPTSGMSFSGATVPAPSQVASAAKPTEKVVVEGWIELSVEDAAATAAALHDEIAHRGGRVVSEQQSGAAESWRASLKLRLPPAQVDGVLEWLARAGEITSKRIEATDVSRTLFDQEIALTNLRVTLDRLRKLLEAGGLKMEDILNVEKEMTRLRGEIERIEGEKRFLEDRVALATLDVQISRREGAVMSPSAKLYPGPRLSLLTLFSPGGRKRNRLGGGVAVHIGIPRFSVELDVFDDVDSTATRPREDHAVLATYGAAMYSDFFGRGERRFLNPYIGARIGYAWLDYHAFALQGDVGVELFKSKYAMVDLNARATGLFGEDHVDAGLVTGIGAVFAF